MRTAQRIAGIAGLAWRSEATVSMSIQARLAAKRDAVPRDLLVVVSASVAAVAYLWWAPTSPDLAAQTARAEVVRLAGNVTWWTGWFGGLSLPSYSVLAPWWMSVVGVHAAGALAAVAGAWAGAILTRGTARPRAGTVAFALAGFADLLVGRVTFVVGFAIAAWALVALRAQRRALTIVAAVATYLVSPLAGLFLGIVLVAVAIADRGIRRRAAIAAGVLLAAGATTALFFPGTGVMPVRVSDMFPPAVGCLIVAALCPQRLVRTVAVLTLIAMPVFLVMPGAVGGNIARLSWVCAAPVVVACARVPRRWLAVAVAAVAAWPISDVVQQVGWVNKPSNDASYYSPLADALAREQAAAGAAATGERLEVTDTVDHAASVHLISTTELARGWDRQADNADNPIFYRQGALTATSYRDWLHGLAVGWVAVPSTSLDYAARKEAGLIRAGLPYLRLAWSNSDWKLYRVLDAAPLATGAAVRAVTPSGITLNSTAAASIALQVRWSAYLRVVDATTGAPVAACISNAHGWTRIYVPRAGTFTVVSPFDPAARFRQADPACTKAAAPR